MFSYLNSPIRRFKLAVTGLHLKLCVCTRLRKVLKSWEHCGLNTLLLNEQLRTLFQQVNVNRVWVGPLHSVYSLVVLYRWYTLCSTNSVLCNRSLIFFLKTERERILEHFSQTVFGGCSVPYRALIVALNASFKVS